MMIKIATVCSGIGSPEFAINELAISQGFEVENVFACEIDKYARASYLANHKPNVMYEDMTSEYFHDKSVYSDIVIGGIPCQPFSLAGNRLGELDKRGLLIYDYYRYVKEKQPKVFILENVKGLLSDNKRKTFQNWLLLLGDTVNGHSKMFNHPDSLGYNLHHTVLNSKNFGVPQNRERVFIIGIRSDLPNDFRFPIGWKLDKRLKDVLETDVDEKYYLSDKMLHGFVQHQLNSQEKGRGFKFEPIEDTENETASTVNARCFKMGVDDNYIKEVTNLQGKDYINTIRTGGRGSLSDKHNWDMVVVKEATKQGFAIAEPGDSINLSNPNSETRRGRVGSKIANTLDTACNQAVVEPYFIQGGLQDHQKQRFDGICPTLTSAMGMGGGQTPIHNVNSRIRRLTPLECWRLQGFSDESYYNAKNNANIDGKIGMSDTQLYKQAGNSMTQSVKKAIINNLLHLL